MCNNGILVVTWRSGSDRGQTQIFRVVVKNIQRDTLKSSDNVSDPGAGSIVQYVTESLPETNYAAYIESTNVYGAVQSDEWVYCNTSGYLS